MQINKILSDLYENYYQENKSESVTSSHWSHYNFNRIEKQGDKFNVKHGAGFGDFIPSNLFRKCRNIVVIAILNNYLKKYCSSDKYIEAGKAIAKKSKRLMTFDCCKQVVIVENLLKHLKAESFSEKGIKKICIIGDGYGYLGALLKEIDPRLKIVSVNLGKQLFYDAYFSNLCNKNLKLKLYDGASCEEADITFIPAEEYAEISNLGIDLFINIASMQEMDPDITSNYFSYMKSNKANEKKVYFYCCNREKKQLPDGTMAIFDDYPWGESETLFESLPSWYEWAPMNRPPFRQKFDGPMKERFVVL